MNWPTWDQVKGIAERLITVGIASVLSLAVLKGWITKEDAIKHGAELAPLFIGIVSAWYAWRVNRPKAIVQSAAALPGTTVVTTSDLARSTPEPNIVSETTNKVELKSEEEITRDLNRAELARHQG